MKSPKGFKGSAQSKACTILTCYIYPPGRVQSHQNKVNPRNARQWLLFLNADVFETSDDHNLYRVGGTVLSFICPLYRGTNLT
jgi:hypothetical protein